MNSEPRLYNNIIVNNESDNYGGGIYMKNTNMDFMNNVISNNLAASGGAIYAEKTVINLQNCIVWGNQQDDDVQIDFVGKPRGELKYCNIQNGYLALGLDENLVLDGVYENNLLFDPMFTEPSASAGIASDGALDALRSITSFIQWF